jgi:periplasmic divalent cation tolerance protein
MDSFQAVMATITAPNLEAAERIARRLVDERLAACVQILDRIRSIYRWQGKVQEEPEALLIVKTAEALIPRIATLLREVHPYEVPELAAVPITAGSTAYLKWLAENL